MEGIPPLILHEYAPVIGIWVDRGIEDKLKKRGINIHAYFDTLSHQNHESATQFRYLNLNNKRTEIKPPMMQVQEILESTAKPFENSDFISDFSIKTPDPNMQFPDSKHYQVNHLKFSMPWVEKTFAELSRSPRATILHHDVPRYIISFVENRSSVKDILSNLPQEMAEELEKAGNVNFYRWEITCNEEKNTFVLKGHNSKQEIKFDSSVKNHDFFKNTPYSETVYNADLASKIRTMVTEILTDLIPNFLTQLIPINILNKNAEAKSNTRFSKLASIFNKEEGIDREKRENNVTFRLALDNLIIRNMEQCKSFLQELLGKTNYGKLWEVKFCYIHILLAQDAPLDDIMIIYKELQQVATDEIMCYLQMLIFKIYTKKKNVKQYEIFLWRLAKYKYLPVTPLCFEMLTAATLKAGRFRRAALFLILARDAYAQKPWREFTAGHTLRCSAFAQNLLVSGTKAPIFTCGKNNITLLSEEPYSVKAPWEELNALTMKHIAKILSRCGQNQYLALFYFNLFAHCQTAGLAEKVFKGLFDAVNRDIERKNSSELMLPFFQVKGDAKCFQYGTPEYFGFEDCEKFRAMVAMWEKKTRSTANIGKHWGIKGSSSEDMPIFLVCGEPAVFHMSIVPKNPSVPLMLNNLFVETIPKKVKNGVIKNVPIRPPPMVAKLEPKLDMERGAHENDEKETGKFVDSELCRHYLTRLETSVNQKLKELNVKMKPINEGAFTVDQIKFMFWDIVPMKILMPEFQFRSLSNQPSLFVKYENFPKCTINGEIYEFTMVVANIGDAPISKLYVMHDAPNVLHISDNLVEHGGNIIIPLVKDQEQSVKPGEELRIKCFLRGQPMPLAIRMVFFFDAQAPLTWRSYCQRLTLATQKFETTEYSVLCDPRDPRRNLIYAALIPTEEEVMLMSARYHGVSFRKYNPAAAGITRRASNALPETNTHDVECFTKNSMGFLLEEGGDGDGERWRDSFLGPNDGGYILCRCRTPGSEEDKSPYMRQHLIKEVPTDICGLKFKVDCPSEAYIDDGPTTIIVTLTIRNAGTEPIENCEIMANPQSQGKDESVQQLFWIGQTTFVGRRIEPGSDETFEFELLLTQSGPFNVASFRVTACGTQIHMPFKRYVVVR